MAKSNIDNSSLKLKAFTRNSPGRQGKKCIHQTKSDVVEKQTADIPLKDFLDFLRTAYQVNQAIEGVPYSLNQNVEVNWKELTNNNIFSELLNSRGPQDKANPIMENSVPGLSSNGSEEVENILKLKLNEVLQEGLLDSMIPYMLPKSPSQPIIKKPLASVEPLKPHLEKVSRIINGPQQIVCNKEKSVVRRKSNTNIENVKYPKGDTEVEIHVCDEVRNIKKKFKCPQNLLVSKMGYFAEVTTGQKLEDMDISVHCDLTIFEWLMKWVKKDTLPEENWPQLEAGNVVSILVSASFLQMHPLENDCLVFLYTNANEILKKSSNLSCLNDSILSKLAKLFSNADVENLVDKKDKIQSRLFCKLIASLVDDQPDSSKGHFSKLSSLYKCIKCEQIIVKEVQSESPCLPQNMKMDQMGKIHFSHARDPLWDLNDHVRSLRFQLGSWRLVYWHLWGECHTLHCSLCRYPFPLLYTTFCVHHMEAPIFLSVGGRAPRGVTLPVGHYPCCAARAFRYEPLPSRAGCKYNDHHPELTSKNEIEIWQIFLKHRSLISQEPPSCPSPYGRLPGPQRKKVDQTIKQEGENIGKTRSIADGSCIQNQPWWTGLNLAPCRSAYGLLTSIWDLYHRANQQLPQQGGSQEGKHFAVAGTSKTMQQKKQVSIEEVSSPTPLSSSSAGDSVSASSSGGDDSSEEEGDWDGAGWVGEGTEEHCRAGEWKGREHKGSNKQLQCTGSVGRWVNSSTGTTKKAYSGAPSTSSLPFHPRKARWMTKFSTRTNQDNQREREEKAMSWASIILTRRTTPGNSLRQKSRSVPLGGIYMRLEQEWREANGLNAQHSKGLHLSNRQRARLGR